MKELNDKQQMAILNALICLQLLFIGLCFWFHTYGILWVWGTWMLGASIIKHLHDKYGYWLGKNEKY